MIVARVVNKIAVVEIHGGIGGKVKSPDMEKLVNRILEDKRMRAVVLDIDSPGGDAAASDYIYRALKRIARRRPLVASIRGIGASGGYMIACAAHQIVAAPGSLVGSIGVISVRPALQELLERAGIGVNVNKSGEFKDMGAPWRETTPEEEAKLQELIDDMYSSFVSIVSESRNIEEERVREIATGEVYLATRAAELGLVDEVGDLDRALDMASKAAGTSKRTVYMRPQRNFMERLMGPLTDSLVGSIAADVERRLWQGRHGM
ncbi:MAG: signal peptide peptidase SppA [Dehalococcoidia bacterium]|nr:signal peptide peptidase SppA [Dehalococcoidia bacterium]